MTSLSTQRTAAGAGVVLALRFVATAVLNYGFGIALIWLLPRSDFGAASVLQNMLLLAAAVLAGGFPWVLARATARADTQGGGSSGPVFRAALIGNLTLGAVLATVAAATQIVPTDSWVLVAALMATIVVISVNTVLGGALQGSRRFDAIGITQTAEVAVKAGLGLGAVALLGLGVTGVGLGFLAGSLVASGLSLRGLRDRLPGRGPVEGRWTFVLALPMGVGTTCFALLVTVDVLALSVLGSGSGVTTATIAIYQAAVILARAPYFLAEALGDAAFPHIARSSGSAAAHAWFSAAFRWLPLALIPVQLVLLVSPGPILRLFLPAEYDEAAGLVRLITVGTLGLMVTTLLLKTLYATGFAVAVARRLPLAAGIEIAALLLLVPWIGEYGAAIAFALGSWAAAGLLAGAYFGHHRTTRFPVTTITRYVGALGVLVAGLVVANSVSEPFDLLLLPAALAGYVGAAVRFGLARDTDLERARHVLDGLKRVGGRIRDHAGRRWRVAALSTCQRALAVGVTIAFVATMFLWNLSKSPDTQYDEIVYTTAAQHVAQGWNLTWTGQPIFVHPPLSFLAQAGWLLLLGRADADLPAAIEATRLLTAVVTVVDVLLLVVLVSRLMPNAGRRRRHVLLIALVALAATDPILLRYGRLDVIEPFAVLACLVTLNLALVLRHRPAAVFVPVVGLVTGIALLTKEIGIFMLVTPLLHAALGRDGERVRTAAGALVVGVGLWLLFPLWAVQLGLLSTFADVKLATFERLLGLSQITGWNRPGASFPSAVVDQAGQYISSYVVLVGGAAAVLWLLLHRLGDTSRWLLAWLFTSYAFAAYTVFLGTLNEQFFMYVLPAALAGSVLVADAVVATRAGRRFSTRLLPRRPPLRALVSPMAALVVVVGFALVSWARFYLPQNDGLIRAAAFVRATVPACSAVNATGDAEKFDFLLPGYTVTDFATGPGALSHGVNLFFLSDKDATERYGNATPELAAWVRSSGVKLVEFPSATYRGVELWQVPADNRDPLAGVEPVAGGSFIVTEGSRCSGFAVVDGPAGNFASGWADMGGKGAAGSPITESWTAAGRSYQAFEGVALATTPGDASVGALPIVRELFERVPEVYRQGGLPPVTVGSRSGRPADAARLALLTDRAIAAAYLGAGVSTDADAVARASGRFGEPLGPAVMMPDGQVRQAFAAAVLEHPVASDEVRLTPVGPRAIAAGILVPSPEAVRPAAPPPIPADNGPVQPTTVEPFVTSLATALGVFAVVAALVAWRRRRGAPAAERVVS